MAWIIKKLSQEIACAKSIRIFLSIVGVDNLHMVQFDIKIAHSNLTIQEVAFMALQQSFEDWFIKTFLGSRGDVCWICKGLYGIKQSARSWNKTFSDFLCEYALTQSVDDPCVIYLTPYPLLILALWVDDGLAMYKDKPLLTKMVLHLKTTFEVIVGVAYVYVGIPITRDLAHHRLYIDQ